MGYSLLKKDCIINTSECRIEMGEYLEYYVESAKDKYSRGQNLVAAQAQFQGLTSEALIDSVK